VVGNYSVIQWFAPVGLILGGILIGLFVDRIALGRLRKLIVRTRWTGDELVINDLRGMPLLWSTLLGVYAAPQSAPLSVSWRNFAQRTLLVITILSVTVLAANVTAKLVGIYARRIEGALPTMSLFANFSSRTARRRSRAAAGADLRSSTESAAGKPEGMIRREMRDKLSDDPLWFKDAIFYEVYVRGFYDSNADGVGDFRGLTEKLDHIQWLGADCILLLPINASPLRDGGYDVSNYYAILPKYGTLEDFKHFLDAAHARGIRVIADLMLNHTSDQHPWFQEARKAPGSLKRDWYVWSETDQKYKEARIIHADTERSNWAWDDQAQAFYWHRFFGHQPDLNYENPEVRQARHPVFGRGSLKLIEPENRKILAFTRGYRDEIALCVYNLARSTQPAELDLNQYEGYTPVEMSGRIRFPRIERRPYQIAFNEYGFFWFLLQKEDR
jgi:hypothetical protein